MSEPLTQHRGNATPSRRARIEEIFTPDAPVARRELFAGRTQPLQQLLELLAQPGRHAVVFGERAVGKTSLVTLVPDFAADPVGSVHVVVGAGDTFGSLWRRVAETVRVQLRRAERGFGSSPFPDDTPTGVGRTGEASLAEVQSLLARLGSGAWTWIVFDEFEHASDEVRARMRELVEASATIAPHATLVFAGTATTGDGLMQPSLALAPVHVARFSSEESIEAVLRALRLLELSATDEAIERIAALANGMPQVVHALARAAAHAAEAAGGTEMGEAELTTAIRTFVIDADDDVRQAYEQATVRARRGIYPEILLACALAPHDTYGTFSVADVCSHVTAIVRREVRGLTNQVSALTEDGRGAVLHKTGAAASARYRFVDPRLEPYILMRGLEDGWATHDAAEWEIATSLPKAA